VFTDYDYSVLHWLNFKWVRLGNLTDRVEHAFSDGQQAYFITPYSFGRVQDDITFLAELDPKGTASFESISGTPAGEVFLTIHDNALADSACGTDVLVWFDGTQFHWF
jgi:hypothetical protein